MRIQRLEITGFKSFNDRVVIGFDEGVTGVVGPNGCGKSNVVDAIRWVMGEQSAKQLRGRSMEDVIFSGSEVRPASGMAEVALTLENDRPAELPNQFRGFGEITVQRRLFRSGESDYLINQQSCRLMDITELFLGTGVGTRAYSIIEQGRIGLIVNAKPEDRRAIIEEAAGITKYKARKNAAERKIEHTEQNLVRLNDLVGELKKRLDSLERQSRKAERYRKLKEEIRELDLRATAMRWLELRGLSAAVNLELLGLSEEERRALASTELLDGAVAASRDALSDLERQIAARTSAVHEIDKAIAHAKQEQEYSVQEQARLAARRATLRGELEALDGRRAGLASEREALLAELAATDELGQGDVPRLTALSNAVGEIETAERALRVAIDSDQRTAATALARASAAESTIANLVRQRADLVRRLASNDEETLALLAQHKAAEARVAGQREAIEGGRQLRLALEGRKGETERGLAQSKAARATCESSLGICRDELAAKGSRLQSLLDLQRSYEGCDRGVRAVMLKREGGLPDGVLGLLADLVRAPADVEVAIEAVLGERLQYILVADMAAALATAGFLKASGEGRGTFVPVGLKTIRPPDRPVAPADPGVIGLAADLVESATEHGQVARALLHDVVIVDELSTALRLREGGSSWTFVTKEGEILWANGALAGGTAEGKGSGELQKRREIGDLDGEVAVLRARQSELQTQEKNLRAHLAQLEDELQSVFQDSHLEDLNRTSREKDLRAADDEVRRCVLRLEQLSQGRLALEQSLAELGLEERTAGGVVSGAGLELAESEARLEAARGELSNLRGMREGAATNLTAQRVKMASLAERRQSLAKQVAQATTALDEGQQRSRIVRVEIDRDELRGHELGETARATGERLERLMDELMGLQADRERLAGEHAVAAAQILREDATLRGERQTLERTRGLLSNLQIKAKESALELGHLEVSIAQRYDVELTAEISRFHLGPVPGPAEFDRMTDLKETVAKLGEVNLTAIEEYREISTRHSFLAAQKEDLENSLDRLREAIVRMNRTSRQRFKETFELVNERFSQIFPRLFAGGHAGLVLTEESGDLLDAGIEIFAQPPGKRLQSVGLLSGGEKALTAVGLIFAIFLIKPTPFCLLDEVDAPLDEANVGRYNELVKEMSKISQFILITHNKRTMEMADTLYGVTMEEPGCSKLVSVKLTGQREASAA